MVRNDQFLELGLQPTTLSEGLLEEGTEIAGKHAHRADVTKIIAGRLEGRHGNLRDLMTGVPDKDNPANRGGRAAPATRWRSVCVSSRNVSCHDGASARGGSDVSLRCRPGPSRRRCCVPGGGTPGGSWLVSIAVSLVVTAVEIAVDHLLSHAGLAAALSGALGSSGVSLLGAVFLAGFLSRLVSAEHGGSCVFCSRRRVSFAPPGAPGRRPLARVSPPPPLAPGRAGGAARC